MRLAQLGVQAHCLRFRIAAGLEQALAEVAALDIGAIELTSFHGCRGDAWGDFGAATDRPPKDIAAAIRNAGLACPSCIVMQGELADERFDATIDWAQAVGVSRVILSSLATPRAGRLRDWQQAFDGLNDIGAGVRARGLQFAYHTQPNLWATLEGTRLADELLRRVDPALCGIEFDPSGAIMYDADPAAYIRQRPESFYAVHLRDSSQPPEPRFYLPAEPLGAGRVDWLALLASAQQSATEWYFLEMEVTEPEQTLAAIAASRQFLLARGLIPALPAQSRSRDRPARPL